MEPALKTPTDAIDLSATMADEVIRVLLIDDDPAYRHLCQRYLSKPDGPAIELECAANASEGILQCQTQHFDCLLIDYTLPETSGTQMYMTLAGMLNQFAPPAIILTADGGQAAATEAVRAGASDFIPKHSVSAKLLSTAILKVVETNKLKRSVEKRSVALQSVNEKLRAKNDQIQRFYQGVSHEVKTPLAAAREFIAIVVDGIAGEVNEQQAEVLTHALDSCDQIAAHFNDLIEMTRLDSEKVTMNRKVGSLNGAVLRSVASVTSAVEAKCITLRQEIESPLPLVLIDTNRIIQVLANLLGNAVKYTQPGGEITLTVKSDIDSSSLRISVTDTGCGIAEENLPQVFERLFQVENGGDEMMGAGLGLGLSIAKEIVSLHDGKIWAESTLGEGSTFAFELPIAKSIFDLAETKV